MNEIFLSASIPERGRGDFDETADPFLVQFAVRELIAVCLGRRRIVWGGHPSITPMVHAVCRDFGVEFEAPVVLYQSTYFRERFPEDNRYFQTILVEGIKDDLSGSLKLLRQAMLSRPLEAAVFIGGMEGILDEFDLFRRLHGSGACAVALSAPGGAARQLANKYGKADLDRIDFARLFHERLGIAPDEPRQLKNWSAPDDNETPPQFHM